MLLAFGINRIAAHNQTLVTRLIDGLDGTGWQLVSPRHEPERSTLVLLRHPDDERTATTFTALTDARIDIAQRAGRLRLSPHLYNTHTQIDRVLDVMAHLG